MIRANCVMLLCLLVANFRYDGKISKPLKKLFLFRKYRTSSY